MKIVFSILFTSLACFSFGQSVEKDSNIDSFFNAKLQAAIGKPFPQFIASSQEGNVSNDLLKGKAVLINFWFEGCHPCMAEMSALNELQEKLKDNKDFLFISFTWDNPATIKRVKEKYGITFKILSASGEECHRLNFGNGYPTNIILDKSGTIKYFHSGGSVKEEEAREFVMTTLLSEIQSVF